ncbi:MAG: hypothetical protein EA385_14655 [Salinarimonadaceae bacterium]|nr:MAG: hypothetical protein EA385_14655 [Salinarimonadaceae bacterium]
MGARIEIGDEGVSVDAALLGEALGVAPEEVMTLMREGAITSLLERGEGEDAGRMRLTFFHGSRRLRLIVGADGEILQRSLVDFGDRPLPPAMRRPGS